VIDARFAGDASAEIAANKNALRSSLGDAFLNSCARTL